MTERRHDDDQIADAVRETLWAALGDAARRVSVGRADILASLFERALWLAVALV